jgi:hypothetical protein
MVIRFFTPVALLMILVLHYVFLDLHIEPQVFIFSIFRNNDVATRHYGGLFKEKTPNSLLGLLLFLGFADLGLVSNVVHF